MSKVEREKIKRATHETEVKQTNTKRIFKKKIKCKNCTKNTTK